MVKSLKCQPCWICRSRDLVGLLQELLFRDAPLGKPCFICEDSWATDESRVNDGTRTPKAATTHTVSKHFPTETLTTWRRMISFCILSFCEVIITLQWHIFDRCWQLNASHMLFVGTKWIPGLSSLLHRLTGTKGQVVKTGQCEHRKKNTIKVNIQRSSMRIKWSLHNRKKQTLTLQY